MDGLAQHLTRPVNAWRSRRASADGTAAPGPAEVTSRVSGIRHRRPGDVEGCASLLRLVYLAEHYPARWPEAPRAWLADDGVLDAWVCERAGEILGHVAISQAGRDAVTTFRWRETTGREPSDLGCVTRFFVRPRVRGQGIGAALLDTAMAGCRSRGLLPVLELLGPGDDAIALVERQGWRLLAIDPTRDDPALKVHSYAGPPEPVDERG
jgi:GNAT superfamily N-acetyltransferase